MRRDQRGLAHAASIALLLVIAAIIFTAYKVVKDHQNTPTAAPTASQTSATGVISNKSDLNQAAATLNQQAVDQDLNPDQLNSDVNGLL
jgi:Cu/Ag efflux protein CusF